MSVEKRINNMEDKQVDLKRQVEALSNLFRLHKKVTDALGERVDVLVEHHVEDSFGESLYEITRRDETKYYINEKPICKKDIILMSEQIKTLWEIVEELISKCKQEIQRLNDRIDQLE